MAKRKNSSEPAAQPELIKGQRDDNATQTPASEQSSARTGAPVGTEAIKTWEIKAKQLAHVIVSGWKDGRVPLFLFGARGTPLVIQEYEHAKMAISDYEAKHGERSYEGTPFSVIEDMRSSGVPRPIQARFFGDLKACNRGDAWDIFCRRFLTDWVVRFLFHFRKQATSSGRSYPKDLDGMYQKVSKYLTSERAPFAIVLTTNFDGAVPEYIKRYGSGPSECGDTSLAQCFVLESAKSIERLAVLGLPGNGENEAEGRTSKLPTSPWIITLRGDVYHAECRNKLCSMRERPVSVYEAFGVAPVEKTKLYELEWDSKIAAILEQPESGQVVAEWSLDKTRIEAFRFEPKKASDTDEVLTASPELTAVVATVVCGILKCPECGGARGLTITFPGQEKKEEEISEIMSAVWEAVGTRISTICTVGFSGNSDREVVNFLARFARKQGCHWFDWTIKDKMRDGEDNSLIPHVRSSSAVMDVAYRNLRERRFHRVEAIGGAAQLTEFLPDIPEHVVPTAAAQSPAVPVDSEVMADLLWIDDTVGDRDIAIPVASDSKTATLRMGFPDAVARLFDHVRAPNPQSVDMLNTSQLAMKDYWWNPLVSTQPKHDPRLHSRMHHSVGFMRVADAWFKYLQSQPGTPSIPGKDDGSGAWHRCLLQAALLHDVGHSPFSHLLEEVFNELHWSLYGRSRFHHEALTQSRSLALLRDFDTQHKNTSVPKAEENYARLARLLDGMTGIHWLDAIMNGPFDADKIDYVFRDQRWLGIGGRQGDCLVWLSEFLAGQQVSPQGHIFLNGTSASAAYRILAERCHLYDSLYFAPKVRVMERIVQYILASFFVLRVSNRVTRHVCDRLRENTSSDLKNLFLDQTFVTGILEGDDRDSPNEGEHQKMERLAAVSRAKRFLEDLFAHANLMACTASASKQPSEAAAVNPPGLSRVSDFGMVKLAYSVAELHMLIDSGFPRLRSFNAHSDVRTQNGQASGTENKGSIQNEHPLERFLSKRKIIEVAELQLIAEIGLWALNEKRRSLKATTGNDNTQRTGEPCIFEAIADACVLVLDPMHGKPSLQQLLQPRQEDSSVSNGRWLNRMLKDHCIGGPYVLRAPAEMSLHEAEDWLDRRKTEIVEIGRELSYQYPGRILVDVTGPLKVRSYPRGRVMHGSNNAPFICEQFWVPSGDPQSWSVTSTASVPLYAIDFRQSIPQAYKIRVLLVDPRREKDGRANLVDRFRKACRDRNISLEDENHG